MEFSYSSGNETLHIKVSRNELDSVYSGKELNFIIAHNCILHERSLRLKYDEEKSSPHVSIVESEGGYDMSIGTRNYADLINGRNVSGQFAKGTLEFNLDLSCIQD